MKTRELGTTGLEISALGFGAWATAAGSWGCYWSGEGDDDSIAAIHEALALGVNWIDTAVDPAGQSEAVVGRALAGLRERPYVFTKSSAFEGPGRRVVARLKRDTVWREAEASLTRLGVEAIDVYQVHRPLADTELEEGWSALAELKEEGLVRHIGVSNFTPRQLRRAQWIAPVETIQPPYSLIRREVEHELLPVAEREDIGVVVHSPMGSGLLTGAVPPESLASGPGEDWRTPAEQVARARGVVDRLRVVAGRHEVTPGEVAIAWTLHNPAVDGAIVGFRRPEQVRAVIGAAALELSEMDVAELELGLAA